MAIVKDLGMVTAYAYAVAGGYEGTEQEFEEMLGQAGVTLEQLENLSAVAVTLTPGSEATASYSDGVLTFGIPQGDKGDKGDTGNGIASIAKTGSSGLVDTYTITYTNGNSMTFTVTNGAQGNPGPTGNGIASIAKTGTSGLVDTYTITFTDGTTTTFTVTNGEDGTVTPEQMAAAIAGALVSFATGKHDNMTAGLAEQLLSDVTTTDKKPYKFRRTGADATREFDTLVGGSVVANQLVAIPASDISKTQNGVTFTDNRDGSYTVATDAGGATAQASVSVADITFEQGHVYYVTGAPSGNTNDNYFIYSPLSGSVTSSGKIFKRTDSTGTTYLTVVVKTGTIIQTGITFRPQIVDLTKMFGSTIADHAYTLEQATAGAGIAWLKSYGFFAGHQAYNAGAMAHVSGVSKHVMTGFNALGMTGRTSEALSAQAYTKLPNIGDNKYYIGLSPDFVGRPTYVSNVSIADGSVSFTEGTTTAYGIAFPFKCLPDTTYYIHAEAVANVNLVPIYCDAEGNYIGRRNSGANNSEFTTPANCAYVVICLSSSAVGNCSVTDLCINLSNPSKNGQYEPYTVNSYALDDTVTLRGLLKLVSDEIVYTGDVYPPSGQVDRRYALVDMGTLDYIYNKTNSAFYASLSAKALGYQNVMCPKYATRSASSGGNWNLQDKEIGGAENGAYVYIKDTAYTDGSALKTSLSGVPLLFELATPTTESATPYQSPQICDPDGTEQYITSGIPVGHETQYPANIKGEIERVMVQVPKPPTSNGTYTLKCTVSGSGTTYAWTT